MKAILKAALIVAVGALVLCFVFRLPGAGSKTRPGQTPAGAAVQIGKSQTRSSMVSSSSSSSSDNSRFSARHVLLIDGDSHPLIRRAVALLVPRLKDCRLVDQVEVTTSSAMRGGAQAPDVFVRINLLDISEEGILSGRTKVTVAGSFGSSPWQSNHYSHDSTTPPLVSFSWNGTLSSESTFKGIRTDRYADLARTIADQFTTAISNELQTLSEKFQELPGLPLDFYGPYQPVPDLPFLKEFKAARVSSCYGLLTHNETFWSLELATNPVPQLQGILHQLEGSNWDLADSALTDTEGCYARLRLGGDELEIFRQPRESVSVRHPTPDQPFVVHYRQPFSAEQRKVAIETLFKESRPIETLLLFKNAFSPAQHERFIALAENSPVTSPKACLSLAEFYLYRKQTNSALRMLLGAKALSILVNDRSALESDIDSLAKKIAPGEKLTLRVSPELCRELRFLEVTNGMPVLNLERSLGEPLLMFGFTQERVEVFALTFFPSRKGVYPWTFTQGREGSRSRTSSSFNLQGSPSWQHSFRFDQQDFKLTARLLSQTNRIRYAIQRFP